MAVQGSEREQGAGAGPATAGALTADATPPPAPGRLDAPAGEPPAAAAVSEPAAAPSVPVAAASAPVAVASVPVAVAPATPRSADGQPASPPGAEETLAAAPRPDRSEPAQRPSDAPSGSASAPAAVLAPAAAGLAVLASAAPGPGRAASPVPSASAPVRPPPLPEGRAASAGPTPPPLPTPQPSPTPPTPPPLPPPPAPLPLPARPPLPIRASAPSPASPNPSRSPAAAVRAASPASGASRPDLATYPELEELTRQAGHPTPERTIRFYVAEGLLPAPADRAGEPVFERRTAVPLLGAIDLLRRRFGRGLPEIRRIVQGLDGEAAALADRLHVLYDEFVRPAAEGAEPAGLDPSQVPDLVERFFARLTEPGRRPAEVSVLDLVHEIESGAARPRRAPAGPSAGASSGSTGQDAAADGVGGARAAAAAAAAAAAEAPALTAERARTLEELFISRFDETMARVCRVPHPLEETLYPAGPRERIHLKRTRADEIIDVMKRHRVYDRELLDALPLDEVSEYRVFTRSLFGRKDVRVVITAACTSPVEELITERCAHSPAGAADIDRVLEVLAPREGTFHFLGILATTGWAEGSERYLPGAQNVLVCLVEPAEGTRWRLRYRADERWAGLTRLFDPETEREKIERARRALLAEPELQLRGGHVLVKEMAERLELSNELLAQAVSEVVRADPQLSVQVVAGRAILKRSRM